MIDVGSDFSGVGAFEQALDRLEIKHNTIYACDIDKYARTTFVHNYGEPKYYPEDVYDREIPEKSLDIYMTSPPCQAFSLAGHRKGEDDDRGVLFYNSHEFIQKNNPRYFIFENVKGLLSDDKGNDNDKIGRTFRRWLDLLGGKSVNGNPLMFPHEESVPYHVYWKVLNAKDYGIPQNRERVFIIGIRDDSDNHFRFPKTMHLKKRLKDVLESDVDKKYYLSDKAISSILLNKDNLQQSKINPEVANTLQSPGNACGTYKGMTAVTNFQGKDINNSLWVGGQGTFTDKHNFDTVIIKTNNKKGYEEAKEGDSIRTSHPNSETRRGRVGDQVAQTIDTASNQAVVMGAIRGRGEDNNQQLEINETGNSNSLTTVQKDNVVLSKNYIQWDVSGKGYNSQQDRAYYEDGHMGALSASNQSGNKHNVAINIRGGSQKNAAEMEDMSPCLTSAMGLGGGHVPIMTNYQIRRLTPRECFRLMDFPDSFILDAVSETQAYKQAGNSICVGVLAKIINNLKL
jgi:DNA (cytosine-5)-methyltransferase 1